jgi:hypothetical protein
MSTFVWFVRPFVSTEAIGSYCFGQRLIRKRPFSSVFVGGRPMPKSRSKL